MSLDAVKRALDASENDFVKTDTVFEKWQDFPISQISHHGGICCETAREWLSAMDFSNLNGGSVLTGPRWIRQRYNWGPTRWQIHWCEAIRQKALDCGALAALAHEVFTMRGVESYRVQFVQQFNEDATKQWSQRWDGEEVSVYWIDQDLIYHEGCAVLTGEKEIKIWDASAAWWINPKQFGGYAGLLALRLSDTSHDSSVFNWGENRIIANQWQKIEKTQKFFLQNG